MSLVTVNKLNTCVRVMWMEQ